MITLIDNYDSFTYNLYHCLSKRDQVLVIKNDMILKNIDKIINSKGVVISPGPSNPFNAGECLDLVHQIYSFIPILGVCLGHQAIVLAYGGKVINSPEIVHGKTSKVMHDRSKLFHGVEKTFLATRYHSLIADRKSIPKHLKITAELENGIIMSIEHQSKPVQGVQFHPESIATEFGTKIIQNFLRI